MQEQNTIYSQTQLVGLHCAWEQTIICRQLFAGHVLGSQPIKRKKNLHQMIICNNNNNNNNNNDVIIIIIIIIIIYYYYYYYVIFISDMFYCSKLQMLASKQPQPTLQVEKRLQMSLHQKNQNLMFLWLKHLMFLMLWGMVKIKMFYYPSNFKF